MTVHQMTIKRRENDENNTSGAQNRVLGPDWKWVTKLIMTAISPILGVAIAMSMFWLKEIRTQQNVNTQAISVHSMDIGVLKESVGYIKQTVAETNATVRDIQSAIRGDR